MSVLGRLVVCVAVLALGLAQPATADSTAVEAAVEPIGALTSQGSFYVEWTSEPTPIPLNAMFELHFRVFAADDREEPLDGASVTASARMPAHNHGTTLEPIVTSHGDGTATAEGFLLHMEGHWQLYVGVAADGRMERATFDIQLEP